ncbi:OB-fold domain-containing protein [Nitratireductor sp. XY-223]|uniref:hydroxymethylglutaryl-CoA synthase family protein n=1 Tax=Nitratireductor sp. XY-223 TaxID=2561926 RepID=UPI0010A9BFCE|nr:OB-fold domain-containing protein [Nitratireductor sp. XY-223]
MTTGILSFGAYLPRARLSRQAIFEANAWFNPGLKSLSVGERTMAGWDEDAVTMSTEAARACLEGKDRRNIGGLYMASTSYPFLDRQNSGIVADALNLRSNVQTLDFASSQRAGTSALLVALGGGSNAHPCIVTAADKRRTKSSTELELTSGDGAAALLVGDGEPLAVLLASHTETVDFVDHFRTEESEFDYTWEQRWVRDEGVMKIVPGAAQSLFSKTTVSPDQVTHACLPFPQKRTNRSLASKIGLREGAVRDNLQSNCGGTGTAHPLLMLAHALEDATPGDIILVAGFGQGCDVLLFQATEALASFRKRAAVEGQLALRREETNYQKFLAFNDLVVMDRGLRAETDKMTGLTTHYRNRDMTQGLVGGKCDRCGTVQYPKADICVNAECNAVSSLQDHPLADMAAKLNSYTADRLTYSADPPAYYGMVQFDVGGRLMTDITDVDPHVGLRVGMPMRMMFRVKDYDPKRGFRRYFWKAAPADIQ